MTKEKTKKAKKPNQPVVEFDRLKAYPAAEALDLTKKLARTKFDASVEVHVRLGIDPKKSDQQIRSTVSLPHGTGKTVRVAAFVTPDKEKDVKEAGADFCGADELIAEIKKTEKTEFDVAVAMPELMKTLAPIAKILGTRGLMPSPKNQTVTPDPAKAVAELKKGKVSFKNDDTGNIHVAIGRISFSAENLLANYQAFIEAVKKAKPSASKGTYIKNITLSSTMGPGIKVQIG